MNALSSIDMNEVTRLTKSGQLHAATALLQQGLLGLRQTTPPAALPDRPALTLEAVPPRAAGGEWSVPPDAETGRPTTTLKTSTRKRAALSPLPRVDAPPTGARFETRSLANAAGRRSYRLYVPSGAGLDRLPLVVMLHGCTQTPDDFARGTRMNALAEELRLVVVYPEQTKGANPSRCWNWFKPGDQEREHGEPSLIAGITREVLRDVAIDPARVFVAGLSAGGAAAAVMAQQYPDLYAGVCIHSGLACGAAKDIPSALAAMRNGGSNGSARGSDVPTIIFHGSADRTVSPVNALQLARQFQPETATTRTVETGRSKDGVGYIRTVETDSAGRSRLELWAIEGAGHAWSGGSPAGSYTAPHGPDASREMMRFFLQATSNAAGCAA